MTETSNKYPPSPYLYASSNNFPAPFPHPPVNYINIASVVPNVTNIASVANVPTLSSSQQSRQINKNNQDNMYLYSLISQSSYSCVPPPVNPQLPYSYTNIPHYNETKFTMSQNNSFHNSKNHYPNNYLSNEIRDRDYSSTNIPRDYRSETTPHNSVSRFSNRTTYGESQRSPGNNGSNPNWCKDSPNYPQAGYRYQNSNSNNSNNNYNSDRSSNSRNYCSSSNNGGNSQYSYSSNQSNGRRNHY